MKTSLFLSTAIGALLVTGVAAAADPINFVPDPAITDGVLSEENELPPVTDVTTTATAKFTYYPDTKKLCGNITFVPATPAFEYASAHIHKGGKTEAKGDILINLATDKGAGEIKVNVTELTAEQITGLTTGDTYVNVHTDAHAGGAMRNQLVQDPADKDYIACEGGDTPDGGTGTGTSSGGTSSGATSSGDGGTKASSSTSGSVTPASTDDGGGCNTTGSSNGDALAALVGLGVVIAAASRKRKKA